MGRVCCVCGSKGISAALIECHKCDNMHIHKYCLRNIPEDINDYVAWFCEDCEPFNAEPLTKVMPDSHLSSEEDEFVNMMDAVLESTFESANMMDAVHESTSETENATTLCMIVPDSVLLNECESVSAKDEEESSFDFDDDVSLMNMLKNKKKRKRRQSQGDKVAEVRSSSNSRSENDEKEQESEKQKLAPVEGEKNGEEKDNVGNDCEVEGEKNVQEGVSGENQALVLVDGEHCKGGGEIVEVGHGNNQDSSEQIDDSQEKDSEQQMTLGLVRWRNLINLTESEDTRGYDGGTNSPVNMLEKGYIVFAQPIIDPAWKGKFCISKEGYGIIGGLSAHLSTLACEKVHNAAKLLPQYLSLDLLPRSENWPKSFEKSRPTDNNIALYFFPESERDGKDYESLIDDMIDNDLAMRVVLESAELFIFVSTQLPIERWRFRSKLYLWGVFRRKQVSKPGKDGISEGKNQQPIEAVPLRMQSPVSPLLGGRLGS